VQSGWLGAGAAGILGAANLGGYLGGALLAPGLARRIGVPWPMRAAMVATTISLALCALPWGLVWFLPWRIIAGIGAGVLMGLAGPSVQAAVPLPMRGLAGGLIFASVGTGSVVAALLEPAMLPHGLSAAWLALAGIGVCATALSWRFWPAPALVGPSASVPGARRLGWAAVLLIVGYGFAGYAAAPHMLWWPDYLARGLGQGVTRGATSWLLWSLCAATGPALFGWLADRAGALRVLVAALLLQVVALLLPLLSTAEPLLDISVMLAGATATGISAMVLNRGRVLAPERPARLWSLCTSAYALTQTLAGFSLAWIYTISGSHLLLFTAGLIASILALIAANPKR